MTKHELIEILARAACVADGGDPDQFSSDHAPTGPYRFTRPWYAPDGEQRPWHAYIKDAEQFLRFKQMEEIFASRGREKGFI